MGSNIADYLFTLLPSPVSGKQHFSLFPVTSGEMGSQIFSILQNSNKPYSAQHKTTNLLTNFGKVKEFIHVILHLDFHRLAACPKMLQTEYKEISNTFTTKKC